MDSETIQELQSMLRALSFVDERLVPLVVDGIDGPQTQNAIRIFQSLYGLPLTGIADYDTWEILRKVFESSTQKPLLPLHPFLHEDFLLRPGETDDIVLLIAYILNSLAKPFPNLQTVIPSTLYDTEIENAVRYLQTLHGIDNNGVIDRQTWNLLAMLYNNRLTSTKG